MAKLILYNDFLSGKTEKAHVLTSLDYISTREGVELNAEKQLKMLTITLHPSTAVKDVSESQKKLIQNLITKYPDLKEDIPFEEFNKQKNMYTASCFIAEACTRLEEMTYSNEIYAKYISERPGVEKDDTDRHGLFDAGGVADVDMVSDELSHHDGNVWRSIISLRRLDAEMLDMDTQEAWKNVIIKHIGELAEEMGIPEENFRWCAAFHNESYHPHVHMMYWSKNDHEGYCSKQTIHNFKSILVNDMFSNELWLHKELKYEYRQQMEDAFQNAFTKKADDAQKEALKELPKTISQDVALLSRMIDPGRSKFYAYQSVDVKEQTDYIVSEILKDKAVHEIFRNYLQTQVDIASFYMKKDSPVMHAYADRMADAILHPGKKDRKVFHNFILDTAYQIRKDDMMKQLTLDEDFNKVNQYLDEQAIPVNEVKNKAELVKSIYRFKNYMNKDPMSCIEAAAGVLPDEDKRLELFLEMKETDRDLSHYQFSKEDWTMLYAAFINREIYQDVRMPAEDHTTFYCAKLIQSFMNFMTSEVNHNMSETRRLLNVHITDIAEMRRTKIKENMKN